MKSTYEGIIHYLPDQSFQSFYDKGDRKKEIFFELIQ